MIRAPVLQGHRIPQRRNIRRPNRKRPKLLPCNPDGYDCMTLPDLSVHTDGVRNTRVDRYVSITVIAIARFSSPNAVQGPFHEFSSPEDRNYEGIDTPQQCQEKSHLAQDVQPVPVLPPSRHLSGDLVPQAQV